MSQTKMNLHQTIRAVMLGHAVADALGVPVEFCDRKKLDGNPVTDMIGFGTYPYPAGSWSDDTSMSLAALDSLGQGTIDFKDIMNKFIRWLEQDEYTPTGETFDVGRTCLHAAIRYLEKESPDFMFVYLGETDEVGGHSVGWMSETYLHYVSAAIDNVRRVYEAVGDEYTIIVTADHGGHDRGHGSDIPEDMTIPMFFIGDGFEAGKKLENVSIMDIAPTIADIMSVVPAPEWEGKSLVR
jgi:hypothetical protein